MIPNHQLNLSGILRNILTRCQPRSRAPPRSLTFNFSAVEFITEEEARNFLITALIEKYGDDRIVERTELNSLEFGQSPHRQVWKMT
jgi:hypothetical protein